MIQLVTFFIGRELYGLDIRQVREVIIPETITHVPHLPDFIEGILDLRGEVIPIADMRIRFGAKNSLSPGERESTDRDDTGRVLITEIEETCIGLRVDGVGKVQRVEESALRPPPRMLAGFGARFVSAICDRPADLGGGVVLILNLVKVFESDELEKLKESAGDEG